MSMLSRPDQFIRQMFDTAIVVEPDTKVHVKILNQVAGPTLVKFQ